MPLHLLKIRMIIWQAEWGQLNCLGETVCCLMYNPETCCLLCYHDCRLPLNAKPKAFLRSWHGAGAVRTSHLELHQPGFKSQFFYLAVVTDEQINSKLSGLKYSASTVGAHSKMPTGCWKQRLVPNLDTSQVLLKAHLSWSFIREVHIVRVSQSQLRKDNDYTAFIIIKVI